ncbi:MAG: cbb3-type cytochrome c oxidase subunit I [Bdellovibrionota bacterium]
MTGLFLGTLATDIHLHDTYFVVAHFHYVMFGGTVIAFIGGLHYWWPKFTGKMFNEFWGQIGAWGVFIGFNLTFMPQFWLVLEVCLDGTMNMIQVLKSSISYLLLAP